MTIQAPTARVSFPCNSVSTVFPVNIQAYLATDFLVLLTNAAGSTTLTLNSDYTLVASGSLSPPFWSLTTQTGQFVSPYVTGNTLQVILNPSETQLSQYTQGQAFPSLAVQTNLDRLTQMVIREGDQLSRAIVAPDGDVNPIMTLPSATVRANTSLVFDSLGNANAVSIATTPITFPGSFVSPASTGMGNGPAFFLGATLGSPGTPTTNAQPLINIATYVAATTGIGNGYVGGAGWFSCYVEGGTGFGKGLTGFTQIDGGSGISAVALHGFGVASASVSGASIWSGWDTTHDNAVSVVNQAFGREIDLVLSAGRARVTGNIGANAGVGLYINNQSDEVGNFNATAAIGITGESNSGGLGFLSQWRTGIFFAQNSIVGGSGIHEAIQINGGNIAANRYTGIRLLSNFDVGMDFSGGAYTGTGAAILLGNAQVIYAIDGSAVGQPVFYMSAGSALILGQGATGGVEFNNTKIGFGTTPVSLIAGYGTPTGGSHQSSFSAGSITLPNLAAWAAQLTIDLKAYGLILS